MMTTKYTSLLQILILIHVACGAEQIVAQELTSNFNSSGVQWVSNKVSQCQTTDFTEFSNQSVMGFFGQGDTTSSKTFTNIPPHWSLSIRFDLILYQSLDPNDYIYVKINGNTDTYQKQSAGGGQFLCFPSNGWRDELVLYYYNITHSSSSITVAIQSQTDEAISNEGYGFKNFYLYVDTCHDSCLTCSGPTANQCLKCPPNSTQSGNTCTCSPGYSALSNQCILTCQAGYVKDSTGQLCVQDFCSTSTCNTCSSGLCTSCKSGFFLLNGYCVSSCPSYSTLNGQQCQDLKSLTSYGNYLLQTMFNTYFGESEIKGAGLTTSGFLGFNSKSSRALTTVCNGKTILGGAYLSSLNAQISSSFTGLQPHWSIAIGYTLYKIDSWDNENVQLIVDGSAQITTVRGLSDGGANLCGRVQYNDQIIYNFKNFTHTSTSLSLQFKTNLDTEPFDESYGIRELFVLVDYCSPNCLVCDAKGCSKCSSSYFLYNLQCVSTCPDGFATDSNKICQPCDSTCLTCSTPQSNTSCLTCKTNTYLNPNKSCLSNCPSKYWTDQTNWKCQVCDPTCYNCISPGDQNSCTSCSGTLYLFSNQCINTCPTNTFYLTQTNNNICQPCHNSCKTCDGPNNNNCQSCLALSLFQQSSKTCVSQCNPNQYQNNSDPNNLICSSCDPSCATCSGPNNNNCVTCTGSLFLYQNQCISNCPKKYYNNTQNNQCTQCDSSCYTCNGIATNNCTSCQLPLYFEPTSNQCLQNCNSNQYPDTNSISCKQCDNSCLTCDGPSTSNCKSCIQGLFLQSKQCLSKCDDSYFVLSSTNICQKCDATCYNCQSPGDSNSCTSCSGSLYLYQNQCISTCPSNTFPILQTNNNICQPCDQSCQTCNGAGNNNCLSCQAPDLFYQQTSKMCVQTCNTNQYQNTSNQTCSSCDPSCASCSGPSNKNCLSCSGNTFLYQNQCIAQCPVNYYNNTQNNQCSPCDSTCYTCNGANNNNCLSCKAPYFYQQVSSTCVSKCNLDQYQNQINQTCSSCDPSCASCSGPTNSNCLSCSGNTFLFENQCITQCPVNYYNNSKNNQCTPCDSTCFTCYGGSSNNCQSCQLPRYLDPVQNQCLTTCNYNQYPDANSVSCKQCDSNCQTCNGPSTSNCLSCKQGLFLQNNQCVQICDGSYYPDPQTNTCQKCDSSCQTCSGPSQSEVIQN
ncbi:zinc finger lsd1 subclass family protein (macronuclear) [Tetrahymena thermophila SB210]|uniref:Zinc finger lsd1 subclass family protein n=1 Tax=Tetrahymena thermophila (strain SB210) TaxID=312017 RepID=Q22Z16_TETTS|nr:zinc finger lsd1 subclass family protein [Tetrahymena thermophila SB210]EAR90505.2 zinc finger lsd1 subclass family protein [Tetrahymena thermophila SB210]|eukprot:XP_001010750.2 zinc finger lsd1 subclass family protein [Tetrahymena thermophila SB210]